MNFKRLLLFGILLTIKCSVFSQEETSSENNFWDNVRYGGGINLGFSNVSTNIGIAPSAIYQFNNKIALGTSISFGYSSFKRNNAKQFNYGASAIFLYNPLKEIQFSGELEQTFVNSSVKIAGQKIRDDFNFPALYLGMGYRLGNIAVGLRYDVLFNESKSIYSDALSPFARVYF